MNWGMPPILSKFNRFQLEDGFIKHAQLAVSVGAGQAGAEVHGVRLESTLDRLAWRGFRPAWSKTFLASSLLDF